MLLVLVMGRGETMVYRRAQPQRQYSLLVDKFKLQVGEPVVEQGREPPLGPTQVLPPITRRNLLPRS